MKRKPKTMLRRILQVEENREEERIDVLLSRQDWAPSRAYVQKLLKNKKVLVNATPVKANYRPAAGDKIVVEVHRPDRKSTRLNSSHVRISYAVFCLKKKKQKK